MCIKSFFNMSLAVLYLVIAGASISGCRNQEHLPEKPTSPDWQGFFRPSDIGISESAYNKWKSPSVIVPDSELKEIETELLVELRTSEVFDCAPYVLNESLRDALREAKNLKYLRIDNKVTSGDLVWICQLSELRYLSMVYANLNDADLSQLKKLGRLSLLDLSYTSLPIGKSLPSIATLETLILGGQKKVAKLVPTEGQFPNLVALFLRHSDVNDEDLKRVAFTNPEIKYLNIAYCDNVTADAVPWLAKLKELRLLFINDSPIQHDLYERDYDGVPALQRLLPKCYISIGT